MKKIGAQDDDIRTDAWSDPARFEASPRQVTAQSDVYGLGAIGYFLLTGKALRSGNLEEMREQALSHEYHDGLFAELRESGSPAFWVELIIGCLEKKYEDGGAVAKAIRDHRNALEQQAEDTRVEAASAKERERSERIKKYLAYLAIVAVFGFAMLGGQWYRSSEGQKRERTRRLAEIEIGVGGRLGETHALIEAGYRSIDHPAQSAKSLRAARRSLSAARDLLAGSELDGLDTRVQEAADRVGQAESDLEVARRLFDLRVEIISSLDTLVSPREAADYYAKVFDSAGLDVRGGRTDQLAQAVRGHRLREFLLPILDHWNLITPHEHDRKALRAVLDEVEPAPDPFLAEWRKARSSYDGKALVALAKKANVSSMPPSAICHLARDLNRFEAWDAQVDLLRAGQRQHPGDFMLNYELGMASKGSGREADRKAAPGYLFAAAALCPPHSMVYCQLGESLRLAGRPAEATEWGNQAIELDKRNAVAHLHLGYVLADGKKYEDAEKSFARAVELRQDFAPAHRSRGSALAELGRLNEATKAYARAIELRPSAPAYDVEFSRVLEDDGKSDEALSRLRGVVERFPNYTPGKVALGGLLTGRGEWDEAVECFTKVLKGAPNHKDAVLGLQQAETLRERDRRLGEFLGQKRKSRGASELIEFAALCRRYKNWHRTAATLYEQAFSGDSRLAAGHRFDAARSAALAGCGRSKEPVALDEADAPRLRKQALGWLRKELAALRLLVAEAETPPRRTEVTKLLSRFQADKELHCVRDDEALARLPEAERNDWKEFWKEVSALVQQNGRREALHPTANREAK